MGVFNELKLRMDDLHRTSEVQQMNLHQGLGAVNQIQVNQKQEDQRLRAIEQQIPKPWAEWESVADLPIVVIMCVLFKNMMIIVESPKCGWFCYTVTQGDDVADSSDGDVVGNADLRPNWNVRRVSDVSDDQHVDLGFFKGDDQRRKLGMSMNGSFLPCDIGLFKPETLRLRSWMVTRLNTNVLFMLNHLKKSKAC